MSVNETAVEQILQTQLSPYLIVKNANEAIKFYEQLFGAKEVFRMPGPNDEVYHAELLIKNTIIMLSDEMPDNKANPSGEGNPVSIGLFVNNVDAVTARAKELGATVEREPETEYYGIRMSSVVDPYGIRWGISTRVEMLSNEEILRRHKEWMKAHGMQQGGAAKYEEKYLKYKAKYLAMKNRLM